MATFVCNVCAAVNPMPQGAMDREGANCGRCGASLRVRSLLYALSSELLGAGLALPDFPALRSLRGLGLSDASTYADRLREKLDYRNTFFDREPRFDIANPPPAEAGLYDFILASEVLEHVNPPVEAAFAAACRLLKPNGILVFTVPYSLDAETLEHFGAVRDFGVAQVGGKTVLVGRDAAGALTATDDVVFHIGCAGPAVEMRLFSESTLRETVLAAGFQELLIYTANAPEFGIVHGESWSLPMVARRGPFALSRDAAREIVEHWRGVHRVLQGLRKSVWFRIGWRLGMYK